MRARGSVIIQHHAHYHSDFMIVSTVILSKTKRWVWTWMFAASVLAVWYLERMSVLRSVFSLVNSDRVFEDWLTSVWYVKSRNRLPLLPGPAYLPIFERRSGQQLLNNTNHQPFSYPASGASVVQFALSSVIGRETCKRIVAACFSQPEGFF